MLPHQKQHERAEAYTDVWCCVSTSRGCGSCMFYLASEYCTHHQTLQRCHLPSWPIATSSMAVADGEIATSSMAVADGEMEPPPTAAAAPATFPTSSLWLAPSSLLSLPPLLLVRVVPLSSLLLSEPPSPLAAPVHASGAAAGQEQNNKISNKKRM
jgi:hypothetical protein